ncbi:MAG TPA: nucleotidyltransferase family protein [Casimicrobiaceae bacterium]|nr:nucleotidyltransferase family protein [Casimicrobiaceae bacterium]
MTRVAPILGILLAAGSATRFGGPKLTVPLADSAPIAVAALRPLLAAVDDVVAVARPGDEELADVLYAHRARVTICPYASEGMGRSLAWGVRAAPLAAGWVIALADMPWIGAATIASIADALRRGSALVAPVYAGQRGHPVGISARFYSTLAALEGDKGAKHLLSTHAAAVELIAVNDPGILRDVDRREDLDLSA